MFYVIVIRILVTRDNIINLTIEKTSSYTPLININWHEIFLRGKDDVGYRVILN